MPYNNNAIISQSSTVLIIHRCVGDSGDSLVRRCSPGRCNSPMCTNVWLKPYLSETYIEVFDSIVPRQVDCFHLAKRYGARLEGNTIRLQPKWAESCGQFSAYFVVVRFLNYGDDFNDVVKSHFSIDTERNECFVKSFITEARERQQYEPKAP